MKLRCIVYFSLIFMISCVSDQINNASYITADLIDPENPPVINFEEPIFNFDTVALGSKVEHTFRF